MAQKLDRCCSRILKYLSTINLQTVVNYWSTRVTRQSTSGLVGDFVHAHFFRQVAKFVGSKIARASTSPHFKEIPAALWTYNFGLSVPQLGGRQRFIGAFQAAPRPVVHDTTLLELWFQRRTSSKGRWSQICPVWFLNMIWLIQNFWQQYEKISVSHVFPPIIIVIVPVFTHRLYSFLCFFYGIWAEHI